MTIKRTYTKNIKFVKRTLGGEKVSTPRVKLINRRKDFGFTQETLSKKVSIDRAYLANIENGKHTPSLQVASRIAHILDMSVEELFL